MTRPIAVLDFGSQYTQLIVRRIREHHVYSKIYYYRTPARDLQKDNVCGIICSGGPASVLTRGAPHPDADIYNLNIPILGICYGLQLMGVLLGGQVGASAKREYGHSTLTLHKKGKLFQLLPKKLRVWNSHGDNILKLPPNFQAIAHTENTDIAVIEDPQRQFYGIQFHPEVAHSEQGATILRNFLYRICQCKGDWSMSHYVHTVVEKIQHTVVEKNVVLGLSGGVDSTVAAALLNKAIGRQLTCVFIDNGLLRLNEYKQVKQLFTKLPLKCLTIKAGAQFVHQLKGVTKPERKRKIIGNTFIKVFEDTVKNRIDNVGFLAQGTLYSDVIESASAPTALPASKLIKSHHNVGGLPKRMKLKLIEPLRDLFKDEVRALGTELGLPKEILERHPSPGPGLAVRVLGEVTPTKLRLLRRADTILLDEIKQNGWYPKLWQAFCVFLPIKTVGVMGDGRTYESVIALRVVESSDAMTADWARLPHDLLRTIANRIVNEVKGINRVVLDITSKPPGTIEWE